MTLQDLQKRYRIREVVDGNGDHWYVPEYRGWFRWKRFVEYNYGGFFHKIRFDSAKSAEVFIAERLRDRLASQKVTVAFHNVTISVAVENPPEPPKEPYVPKVEPVNLAPEWRTRP